MPGQKYRYLTLGTYALAAIAFLFFMWSAGKWFRGRDHEHPVVENGQGAPSASPVPTDGVVDLVTNRRIDDSLSGQLVSAAAEGDLTRVTGLLSDGVVPNALDSQNYGAVHMAAASNSPEIVNVLLEAGAEVDLPDGIGWSPLTWAAYMGSNAAAERLLLAGADPNSKAEPNFVTPLQQLVGGWSMARNERPTAPPHRAPSRLDIAERLLISGANTNDPPGLLLQQAALIENIDLVRILLDHGAALDGAPHYDLLIRRPGPIGDLLRESAESASRN